jgi:peptidoglycan/xylan/chitin deacetylase (PgdA/CDA1 family)
MRMKQFLKRGVAYALYYSGFLWLYAAAKLRRRAVVLMYHRVLPAEADTFSEHSIVVSPQTFSRQMAFLRRHFRPLSLSTLAELLAKRQRPPSMSCVITFDDGWQDNFEHALPLLRQHDVPATIFVATSFIGSDRCFWQEALTRRMVAAVKCGGHAGACVEQRLGQSFDASNASELRLCVRAAVTKMKAWPADGVRKFSTALDEALAAAGVDVSSLGADRFMSWEQVRKLTLEPGINVGAHGCSHAPLTSLQPDFASQELRDSRGHIESATGKNVLAIAYPNGDFDDTVVAGARQAGYSLGFTTRRGLVNGNEDPLKLRRINIHESANATMPEFLCTLVGIFSKWPPPDPIPTSNAHTGH